MTRVNLVRLRRLMRKINLDHLLIGGGDGSGMRAEIVARLTRHRRWRR